MVKRDPAQSSGGGGGGGGGGSGARSVKTFIPEPEYPDEDGDAPRVDIEHINLVSDSEEDKTSDDLIVTGSRPVRKPHQANKYGLKPIRLHREEHKDRVNQVNTEPAVKLAPESDSEELPTIDELRSTGVWHKRKDSKGAFAEEVRVKAEPGVEMPLRESTVEPIVPPSPESKQKVKAQILAPSSAIDRDSEHEDNAIPTAQKERKVRRPSKKKDKKPVLQTEEDKAEWERHLEDMDVLAKELGGLQGNLSLRPQDADGDFAMGDGPKEKDPGRIYLFQFPPVLPELYNPLTSQKPKPKGFVKAEKEDGKDKDKGKGKSKNKDVDMTGISEGAKAKGTGKQTGDVTETAVKIEEDTILADAAVKHPAEGARKKKDEFVHEEGWIGKLIVRESGRVELNWGGAHLLVGRGAEAGFLSNALVVDGIERGPPGGGAPEGKATSMGQVMGKFVVTPDLEKST
jgi:DNA-directed RNA polymerase III subunit RPC4